MESKNISPAVIKRLPRYYRYLGDLLKSGIDRISSKDLSEKMQVTASQIRQDLNNFGGFSVNEFLKKGKVLPVLNDKGEILKGVNATKELIRNLKMYPPICLENVDKKLYSEKLAYHENLLEKRHRDIIDSYNKLISKSFMYSNNKYNINNIIDVISGGIFISDSEFYLLKKLNPRHLFFELFGIKKKRNYIYMIQNDTGYILRGSRNYYYGLAFRSNKGDIDKNLAEKINYNYFEFLNQVVNKMRNYKYVNNYIDRKILLGIMDNIRNMLLVFINVIIQKYVGENNVVVNLESENFKKITNIILKNLKFMYRELFFGNYYNLYNEYLSFLEVEVIGKFKKIYLEEYNSLESSFNYKKAYRVWRETDSFLENVMVIENTISNFSISKSCNFYGMRYGAIELPFIMKMILDEKFKQNNKNKYFIISSKNNYFLNHSDNNRLKYQSYEIKTENINNLQKSQNIILEDNILTGRTLQVVINDFLDNNIYIDKLIIVRYPTLNRIEHMMIKGGHGCPNTDLFSNKIIGLISPAPYSKFNQVYEVRTLKNLYKDELGVFNTTRHAIVRFLYKNKDFAIGSEVDYLVKGAENEYIRY